MAKKVKRSKDIPGVPDGTPTFKRDLPVELTGEELQKKGKAAAKLEDEVDVLTVELKEMGKEKRGDIAKKRAEARQLMKEISSGTEDRPVLCYEAKDYTRGEVRVIRADQGKAVESRTMDAAERQEDMPFAKPKRGAVGDGKAKGKSPRLRALNGGVEDAAPPPELGDEFSRDLA